MKDATSYSIPTNVPGYQILNKLGKGGMAEVYQARDLRLERNVAIKFVPSDSIDVEQALLEAKALAKINHPNVVQIFDVISFEHHLAIVMEYVDGFPVKQAILSHCPDRLEKLNWLIQLAQGVKGIHQAGLIHGDIKPANLLVSASGQIKIVDFGIAQHGHERQAGYATGHYASPEQLAAQKLTFRSDIFSLGIVAFEMFADLHPFGAQDDIVKNIQKGKVLDARQIIPALNTELVELINRLLHHNVEGRPASLNEVESALYQIQKLLAMEGDYGQETQDLSDIVKPQTSWRSKAWLLAPIIVVCCVLVVFLWPKSAPEQRFVLVKKPIFSDGAASRGNFDHTLLATIDDAMRRSIIKHEEMQLLPDNFADSDLNNVKDMASQSGATDVIWSEVSCVESGCEVTTSLLNQNAKATPWTVTEERTWTVQTQTPISIYNAANDNLRLLMPQLTQVKNALVSAEAYEQYIVLYSRFWFRDEYDDAMLSELDSLLYKYPNLESGYSLYRVIGINLHAQSGDDGYLQRLETRLHAAPPEFKGTVTYAIELFLLKMAQNQFDSAFPLLALIAKRHSGEALLNELTAKYYLSSGDLAQAAESYNKAALARPSVSNLYGLAYAYYSLGNLAEAERTLLKVRQIDQNYQAALHLLANIYVMQEKLTLAIELYSILIELSPHSFYLSNLSVAYMLDRQFEKAHVTAQQAVDKNPLNINWLLNLADTKQILGMSEAAGAVYLNVIQNVVSDDANSLNDCSASKCSDR